MDFDFALHKIGQCGRCQLFMYFFCGFLGMSLYMWNLLAAVTFLAGSPAYFCTSEEDEIKELPLNYQPNEADLTDRSTVQIEDISNVVYFENEGLCPNEKLAFNLSTSGRTMVSEWGLVGDKAKWVALPQTLYMTAMMIGAIVLGQFSDKYGRRPVFLLSNILLCLVGVAQAFAPNVYIFGALRFLNGFLDPGVMLTSYIFAIEIFPSEKRATAGIMLAFFNAFGCISLAAMAFFITDWRYLQTTMSGVRIFLLPLCCMVPESLQWLLSHGKFDEAERILRIMAKINGANVEYPILQLCSDEKAGCETEESTASSSPDLIKIKKDMQEQFLFDSMLSLNRDYIPYDDVFNGDYDIASSCSEAEVDFLENQKNVELYQNQSASHNAMDAPSLITSPTSSKFPTLRLNELKLFPQRTTDQNSVCVNNNRMFGSSLSILSELAKEDSSLNEGFDDDFYSSVDGTSQQLVSPHYLEVVPEEIPEIPPLKTEFRIQQELAQGSMSLCNLEDLMSLKKTSEINLTESPLRNIPFVPCERSSSENSLSKPLRKCNSAPACLPHLYRTSSLPNIKVTADKQKSSSSKNHLPNLTKKHKKPHKTLHGFLHHLVSTPSDGGHHMSFLSIPPALSLTNGFSQTLFPGIGLQYMSPEEPYYQSDESLCDGAESYASSVSDLGFYSDGQEQETGLMYKQVTLKDPESSPKHKNYTILDLFRTRSLRLVSVLSMFIWFSSYAIYVGVSMNAGDLAGNVYLNFSLVGLVDIPAVILSVLSAVRIGRRIPPVIFHIGAFLCCLVYLVLPNDMDPAIYSFLSVGSILLTKTLISAAFNIEYLLTCELFPIPLRSVGMGVMTLASRLGGVFSTFVLILGKDSPKYPVIIFSVLSLLASIAVLPMPETKGQPQPQTVEDVKRIRKASQNSRFSLPSISRKSSRDEIEAANRHAEWV